MRENYTIKQELIALYGRICFLGGSLDDQNVITYHHIKPVREGIETTVENGALLSLHMHWLFNRIEALDPKFAKCLNDYFIYYKATKDEKKRLYMFRKALTLYQKLIKDDPKEVSVLKKRIFNNG